MSPKRAKITRSGKQFYLPGRTSEGELARDQELLNAIGKNVSVEEAEKAVAQIRQQREEELKRSADEKIDVQGGKRARIKRGGIDYYMPVRTADGERARDQELLNSIGMNMSVEETKEAVRKIRRQRDSEVGLGGVGGSSQGREGGEKKPRRTSLGKGETVGALEKAMLQAQHREMTEEAKRHEAMRCFLVFSHALIYISTRDVRTN